MADRITEERLRITADLGFRLHDDEVRAIAAELLAARARIAKLEQEPPMALVDFGVSVNWKGLHEDMQRLRAELDAARAEVERCVWNMAGISTIACAENLSHYTPGQNWERAALSDVVRLVRRVTEVRAEVERLRADLREAMELLRAHGQPPDWLKLGDAADWNTRYGALLLKHKEATDV